MSDTTTDTTTTDTTATPETVVYDEGAFGSYDWEAVRAQHNQGQEQTQAADPVEDEQIPEPDPKQAQALADDQLVVIDVDGKPVEMTFKAAKALVAETAKATVEARKAKALYDLAVEDPVAFLRETGKDPMKFAEEFYEKQANATYQEELKRAEEARLTPEQKKLREYEEKLKKYEEAEAAKKKAEEETQLRAAEEEYAKSFNTKMEEAAKAAGLLVDGKVPPSVRRAMSQAQLKALDNGVQLDAAKLADIGKKHVRTQGIAAFEGLDGDALLDAFPELAERFRKAVVERARKKNPNATVVQTHVRTPAASAETKGKTPAKAAKERPLSFNEQWKKWGI